jgi:predicted ATPase
MLFRRLAVFNGGFLLEAAHAIVEDGQLTGGAVDEALANLVAKSLVTATFVADGAHYRLLETTRAYAREQLSASGEHNQVARRHAGYYRQVFERGEAEWQARPTSEWLDEYAFHLDNLRAALDWAFSDRDAGAIAVALTATAVPLWFQLSLVDECLGRVARAFSSLDTMPEEDLRRRMQLYGALGWPRMRATAGLASGAVAWQKTLELADLVGDEDYQQRALWALWVDRTNKGEPRAALALAERFAALAREMGAPAEERIGDRMRARSLHLLGDLTGALAHVERMLDRYVPPDAGSHLARFQYDQRLLARITLARVLWLSGRADQALREIESSVEAAGSLHHALTFAHVLSDAACPIALMAGDLDLAERYTAMLHEQTKDHALDVWNTYAVGFTGEIMIRRGEVAMGLDRLRRAIETLAQAGFVLYQTSFMAALAQGLAASAKLTGALATIDETIGQCGRTGEAWLLAELHRIRGEVQLLGHGDWASREGEASLLRALEIAGKQGALAWELRAATSLAQHWHRMHRSADAGALLSPVLTKFTEGFGTPDYRAASALLSDIGSARGA